MNFIQNNLYKFILTYLFNLKYNFIDLSIYDISYVT